jgi:hypothetical protein
MIYKLVKYRLQRIILNLCIINSVEDSPWEADNRSAGPEIPVFYRTRWFTAVFITAVTGAYPEPVESSPLPRIIFI